MKTTIQKFTVDKNGKKKKANGTVNHIRSAAIYTDTLTVEVDGISASGKKYMTTMSLKASDSEAMMNKIAMQKLGADGIAQCLGFGLPILSKPVQRCYGIEIDGQHFFVIRTMADLQNLCTFINT